MKRQVSIAIDIGRRTSCPFCRGDLLPEETLVGCAACSTVHHRECWRENQSQCAVYGCQTSTNYDASWRLGSGASFVLPAGTTFEDRGPSGLALCLSHRGFAENPLESIGLVLTLLSLVGLLALLVLTVFNWFVLGMVGLLLYVAGYQLWQILGRSVLSLDTSGLALSRQMLGFEHRNRIALVDLEPFEIVDLGDNQRAVVTPSARNLRLGHKLSFKAQKWLVELLNRTARALKVRQQTGSPEYDRELEQQRQRHRIAVTESPNGLSVELGPDGWDGHWATLALAFVLLGVGIAVQWAIWLASGVSWGTAVIPILWWGVTLSIVSRARKGNFTRVQLEVDHQGIQITRSTFLRPTQRVRLLLEQLDGRFDVVSGALRLKTGTGESLSFGSHLPDSHCHWLATQLNRALTQVEAHKKHKGTAPLSDLPGV